jgi:vanillate O-demethylase monooxygenase subunit
MHVSANWQLLVDNILDLTHVAYVHASTIGGNAQQHFAAPTQVKFDGNRVKLLRQMPSSIPPATYVKAAKFTGLVDRWQEVEFEPRLGMLLRVNAGACDAGTGAYEGKRDHGFMFANIHGVTPETETTTHYIWSIATNAPRETGAPEVLFEQIQATIQEDEAVLEMQQARISETPNAKFMGIASDGAVNQGRRLLSALHEAEDSPRIAAE